nr:hypothetical protein Iba_chr11aCG8900 [Ipomoea batatas]
MIQHFSQHLQAQHHYNFLFVPQVLASSHPEQETNSLSFCLYESGEFGNDHFHQEGLSPLELPIVQAFKVLHQSSLFYLSFQ